MPPFSPLWASPPRWSLAVSSLESPPSFPGFGAAYGTAKSGVGISAMGVLRPDLVFRAIIPVVMAGIIAIYGLVVSVLSANSRKGSAFLFLKHI